MTDEELEEHDSGVVASLRLLFADMDYERKVQVFEEACNGEIRAMPGFVYDRVVANLREIQQNASYLSGACYALEQNACSSLADLNQS